MKKILTTERLTLREMNMDDAPFILKLLNTPGWLKYIGDRGVHTLEDAKEYLQKKMIDEYFTNGFGMWMMELNDSHTSIGTCGLIKRPKLEDVDIGFAILPEFAKQGYALEAASATFDLAVNVLKIQRVVAITTLGNTNSQKLLKRIGMHFEKMVQYDDGEELMLFSN